MKILVLPTLLLLSIAQGAPVQEEDAHACVSSCAGVRNGDYHSCLGCHVYASCSNGILHDDRPCPSNLVWDDVLKRCEYTSTTCNDKKEGNCISSCQGLQNGDYQSCLGCHVYATCSNEILYDNRPCPSNLVWDDNIKRCEYTSATCSESSADSDSGSSGSCISSCQGLRNGDYQSCLGCHVYATCSNEILYDNRPCPSNLVWDDNLKRCEYSSATCSSTDHKDDQGSEVTPGSCVSSCVGIQDGHYHSCLGCDVYASCSNEYLYDNRPCPSNLVWNDNAKRCEYWSPTCPLVAKEEKEEAVTVVAPRDCMSDCTGVPDGDYHSCFGCDLFATCSNGNLIDNRTCPDGLLWNDIIKRCDRWSPTCPLEDDSNNKIAEPEIQDGVSKMADDTGAVCVSSCVGVADGDYQSCVSCSVYVTCSNGAIIEGRPCPENLVWDDVSKSCTGASTTCTEPEGSGAP